MNISSNLTTLLFERDITQKQLAEALKMSPSTINGYITKGREPDIETLIRLALYFNVTIDYLLGFNVMNKTSDGKMLTKNDNEMIHLFRRMDIKQQNYLIDQIKFMIRQNNKNETPYV
ncbi:MAG: helix-turn-helix domain-containing protein [Defluviitaleaceae bacterium]|nr:helix-turn-helix domain-containing protein [Defluviitaleaceae bacterium]